MNYKFYLLDYVGAVAKQMLVAETARHKQNDNTYSGLMVNIFDFEIRGNNCITIGNYSIYTKLNDIKQ